ncbi:GAF domain-containing protein [Pseudonocardia sediminis]|uniref:GAF domain-containing protein n=1 Tax=Pseudonocardia sediminis TaxID=1397368 RepID=A0A4Q7UY22_PSEST|nr:GAF and ANTAR domain-containing protein [Pseudonocardia sediminis]RZT86695.1 GAF domain-containing protein [Pseudonocardia sediminis]
MTEPGAVTRSLLAIPGNGTDSSTWAGQICAACIDGLDIDGAALSVLSGSTARRTLCASGPVAERLEELQFSLNEGVCMEAAATGRPVLVPDLREATEAARWPLFAAAVAERTTVTALFALPLQCGVINLGVIDLHRNRAGALSPQQQRDALDATETATELMLGMHGAPRPPAGGPAPQWLDTPAGSRTEVHQATGVVLAQLGISAVDALARLRGYAFAHDRLMGDVARDVIDRRLAFTDDMS